MRVIKGYKIKEPEDWDFEVPADSSQCIRDFLDAWERDDRMTDCYMKALPPQSILAAKFQAVLG